MSREILRDGRLQMRRAGLLPEPPAQLELLSLHASSHKASYGELIFLAGGAGEPPLIR